MKYLIGNLKMNLLSPDDAKQYLSVFERECQGKAWEHVELVLCPAFVHLGFFSEHRLGQVKLGGQNAFFEREGSFTGEISSEMLKRYGAEYVIFGHSERRLYAGETDEIVRKKVDVALKSLLRPIVCVGETQEERRKEETVAVLERMIVSLFQGMSKMQAEKIVIAYEPRWAIGSDITPSTEDIFGIRILIRKILTELLDAKTADRIPVLYGGSVKSTNLSSVCLEAEMDGVLVGRESLFPYEIVKMADIFEEKERQLGMASSSVERIRIS